MKAYYQVNIWEGDMVKKHTRTIPVNFVGEESVVGWAEGVGVAIVFGSLQSSNHCAHVVHIGNT